VSRSAPYVAVIGPGDASPEQERSAEDVGRGIAAAGAVLLCGGLGGVMAAACRGAHEAGGLTVGLLPGSDRADANAWVTIAIATGMGELRNGLIARAADGLIAIGCGYGTLSEIAFALRLDKPVVGIGTWDIDAPVARVPDAGAAVRRVLELVTGAAQS